MLKESYETYTNITTDIIVYNTTASVLSYTKDTYARVLNGEVKINDYLNLKEQECNLFFFSPSSVQAE